MSGKTVVLHTVSLSRTQCQCNGVTVAFLVSISATRLEEKRVMHPSTR